MAEGSFVRVKATKVNLDARTINPIIEKALGKRAISVTQKPELRKKIGEEYLAAVTPFVPEGATGQLRESGRATDDGRVYWTAVRPSSGEEGSYAYNYAASAYDEKYRRWGKDETYVAPHTDGTHPRWTEKVQPGTPEWAAFVNKIQEDIVEAFRDE